MVGGQCHTLEMTLEEVAIIVGQLLPGAARAKIAAQRRHDERLDLGGGNAADQSERRGLILQHSLGDVIAVAGEPRSRQRRARAWAASLACTAANRARSTIGACSPPWTSPR